MKLDLSEIVHGENVLAGAAYGAVVQSQFVARVRSLTAPTVVALNFLGISVATGSFLRESVLGFRDYCRRSQPNLSPVVANPNDKVLEELRVLLVPRREALVCCVLGTDDRPASARVEGVLEEKQIITLDAVLAAGEA